MRLVAATLATLLSACTVHVTHVHPIVARVEAPKPQAGPEYKIELESFYYNGSPEYLTEALGVHIGTFDYQVKVEIGTLLAQGEMYSSCGNYPDSAIIHNKGVLLGVALNKASPNYDDLRLKLAGSISKEPRPLPAAQDLEILLNNSI